MADGLMGKLTLDVSGVMKSIDDLQKGLANLGKGGGSGNINIPGIDALKTDLTNLSKQLTDINTQINSLGSAGGGGGNNNSVKELINLYKELETVNQKMFRTDSGTMMMDS